MTALLLLPLLHSVLLPNTISQSFRPNSDGGRIVGGRSTSIYEHPYQVSLQFNNRHVCGGAVIGEEWIITAAHCVRGPLSRLMTIKCGTGDLTEPGTVIDVKEIISHEKYTRATSDYDIAVIRVKDRLAYGPGIKPINLAATGDRYAAGSTAVVTGWGALSNSGPLTEKLREVEVPLISDAECARSYPVRFITPRMLCAGYVNVGGRDACQGDSGGPLVQGDKLIGIVSWGFGCASPRYPGVYTRVAELRSWIREKTGL